jgi:hypothetical protein
LGSCRLRRQGYFRSQPVQSWRRIFACRTSAYVDILTSSTEISISSLGRKGKRKGLPSSSSKQFDLVSARFGKRKRASSDPPDDNESPAKRKRGHASDFGKHRDNLAGVSSTREGKKEGLPKTSIDQGGPPEDSEDEIMHHYLTEQSVSRTSQQEDSTEPYPVPNSNGASTQNLPKRRKQSRPASDQYNDATPTERSEQVEGVSNHDSPLFGSSDCGSPPHDTQDASDTKTTNANTAQSSNSGALPSESAPPNPGPVIPSHRARAANPLVKMVDGVTFHGMEGAISVKTRLLRNAAPVSGRSPAGPSNPQKDSAASSSSRPKPSPPLSRGLQKKNVSSLLTFQKGSLQTVKGKYSSLAEDKQPPWATNMSDIAPSASENNRHEDGQMWADMLGSDAHAIPGLGNFNRNLPLQPQPVPTGSELLQLAGLDAKIAETLPDFDDDESAPEAATAPAGQSEQADKNDSLLLRR